MPEERQFDSAVYIEENYAGETNRPTRAFPCNRCGAIIERWRGDNDLQCDCGTWYNSFGQRLRDDWQDNPSNYDSEIGDMEGFELSQLAKEREQYRE